MRKRDQPQKEEKEKIGDIEKIVSYLCARSALKFFTRFLTLYFFFLLPQVHEPHVIQSK